MTPHNNSTTSSTKHKHQNKQVLRTWGTIVRRGALQLAHQLGWLCQLEGSMTKSSFAHFLNLSPKMKYFGFDNENAFDVMSKMHPQICKNRKMLCCVQKSSQALRIALEMHPKFPPTQRVHKDHSQALRIALEMPAKSEKDAKSANLRSKALPGLTYSTQNACKERKRCEE